MLVATACIPIYATARSILVMRGDTYNFGAADNNSKGVINVELIEAYAMCSAHCYEDIRIGDEVEAIENLGQYSNNKEPGCRYIINEIEICDPFYCTHCLTNKISIKGKIIGSRDTISLCNIKLSDANGREYKSVLAPPYKITNRSGKYED